jgi:hypothetical protein
MRIAFGKKRAPSPPPLMRGVELAHAVVGKTEVIQELQAMPDNGYAMLILMKPENDGMYIKSVCYPPGKDDILYEGLYQHALRYLSWKVERSG